MKNQSEWRVRKVPLTTSERLLVSSLAIGALALGALLVVFVMTGCHVGELAAPCDSQTLEALSLDCRAQVRASCARDGGAVDESCPALKECDRRIAAWEACSGDAGVGGSGGSSGAP